MSDLPISIRIAVMTAAIVFASAYGQAPASDVASRGEPWARHIIDDSSEGADGVRLADANGNGLIDIVVAWEEGGISRAYLNPGPAQARLPWPAVTVGRTPDAEDAVFVDLDGDGAMDVISSCEGRTKTIFVNWAPREEARYLDPEAWITEAIPDSVGKTLWMFCVPAKLDARYGVDLVFGSRNPGGMVGFYRAGRDRRALGGYTWHKLSDAGWIMSLAAIDMNGNGDLDILISDRRGDLRGVRWLENPGAEHVRGREWVNHFVGGKDSEVMFLAVGDLNGNGLDDIAVAAKHGGRSGAILCYYRQDATGLKWDEQMIPFPPGVGSAKGIAIGDIDGDGRADIVISCEDAGRRSGVVWLRQEADGTWTPREISGPAGMKFDLIKLVDLNGNGKLDVLACEESDVNSRGEKHGLGVFWYENPYK